MERCNLRRMRVATAAALALAVGVPASGAVHVVGAGRTFSQITAAIQAAQDGDTILVKSGSYAPFTIDGKGLTIVADQGESVFVGILGILPKRSIVKNLPAGKSVVLRGIDGPLALFANAGTVRLEDCDIVGEAGDCSPLGCADPTPAVHVQDSAPVAITRCTLTGGTGGSYQVSPFDLCTAGGTGLFVSNATVALYDTTLAGGPAGVGCTGTGAPVDDAAGVVLDGLAPQHRFSATSPLRKAQLGSLDFSGLPGDVPILLITGGTDFLDAPQYQGVLLVGPISGVAVLGALPASGTLSLPLFIGDLPPPGLQALDLHLQTAYATGGGFVLAEPTVVTMLDPAF